MNDDEKKVADFLATGGKVTKCPPGPSEGVVYRRGSFARRRPEDKPHSPAAAPAASAPPTDPTPTESQE